MTKVQWLRNIPRAPVLTLEDVMAAIDVILSEAEAVTDPEAWRRPGLLRAVELEFDDLLRVQPRQRDLLGMF